MKIIDLSTVSFDENDRGGELGSGSPVGRNSKLYRIRSSIGCTD